MNSTVCANSLRCVYRCALAHAGGIFALACSLVTTAKTCLKVFGKTFDRLGQARILRRIVAVPELVEGCRIATAAPIVHRPKLRLVDINLHHDQRGPCLESVVNYLAQGSDVGVVGVRGGVESRCLGLDGDRVLAIDIWHWY